ncbi:MAG TPA: flippase [Isosphaeraceae bacterium]|nr:flippase [Isosphaeraceae bacterium]
MIAQSTRSALREPPPTALTGGRLLARNAAWNLVSQCLPMAVAVVTIPALIGGLGTDRFGVLTLAWILLGYFSLFDLGLGRALTKMVAERLGLGLERDIPGLVWTTLGLMMALGLVGAMTIGLISPWLVRDVLRVPGALQAESRGAFVLMAVALPFVVSTAGLRGVMEAHQRFGPINVVRAAVGLFTLIGPLLVLPFSRSLVPVVAVICAGRLASWAIHLWLCFRTVPGMRRRFALRPDLWKPLLCYGGWMTVANIINPLMVQMDRFLVGALISTAAVAYYTTPYELVTKYWFLSNAMLGVIFPAFATSFVRDRSRTALIFGRGVKYAFLTLYPLTLATITLAPEVLALWLGADFARQSTRVMQWLALGVLLNGLAQVPSALMQGIGRPDLTAKLHLVELPPYLLVAWHLIGTRGIEGAALAWTARTALDLVLFFGTARLVLPGGAAAIRRLARALGLALPVMAACALPPGLGVRAPLLLISLGGFALAAWRLALTPEERGLILGQLAAPWAPDRAGTGRGGLAPLEVTAPAME